MISPSFHISYVSQDGTVKQRSRRGGRQRQLPVLMPATQAPKVSIQVIQIYSRFLSLTSHQSEKRKKENEKEKKATAEHCNCTRWNKTHEETPSAHKSSCCTQRIQRRTGKNWVFLTPDLTTPHKWHRTRVFRPCRSVPEARRTCFAHFVAESSENIPFSSLNNILDSW